MMDNAGQNKGVGALPAGFLNLLVPGLGTIWLGRPWAGLACGLIFAACANLAIYAVLLVPDDLPTWAPPLAIGVAAGLYVGSQVQFGRSLRECRRAAQQAVRRTALSAVRDCLERGDYSGGLAALRPVGHLAKQDLLVAYRAAQVLTGLGDKKAASQAWRQVRALDRHHIYRDDWRTDSGGLLNSTEVRGAPSGPDSYV